MDSKIQLLAQELVDKKIDWLKFRTYDIYSEGVPESILYTIQDIYNYHKDTGLKEPVILRLGNGHGKDLYIQNYILNRLDIKPNYFLLDYNQELQLESTKHNSNISKDRYVCHNLFKPLIQNGALKKLIGLVDVIDCQEVLHEVASVGLGGSIKHLSQLISQFKIFLKAGGLVTICDVNITSNNQEDLVYFSTTQRFSQLVRLFNLKVPESDIVPMGEEKFESSIKWLAIFMGKYRFLENESPPNKREFLEIHKNLTIESWKEMLKTSHLTYIHHNFLRTPQVIAEDVSRNIVVDQKNLPPFSVHILAIS